jgi:PAS domain S-box-containing protein
VIGFNQDITRSKLAQLEIEHNLEELKAATDRQSGILNALPPNVVLLNEAGKIVAVNESWRRFTLANNLGIPKYGIDYSYQAISEKATGVDGWTAGEIAVGLKEVIAGTRDEFSIEYSCVINQKKVWFQLIVSPLTDKTKKGAVVLHIDITDRKKAEEAMLQSEANLSTIFENTDIGYVLCDTAHKIVSFNAKANDLSIGQFGKPLKTGNNGFAFFPKDKIPNIKKAIDKVLHNEVISYETSYSLSDGRIKWYDVRWIGVTGKKGANSGFILAFNDITARKISNIESDRITADLVKRNKDLEQFTYIVSHNLRAPVANIIGLSNMLNNFELDINECDEIKRALSNSINILDQTIMDLNHILEVSSHADVKNEVVSLKGLMDDLTLNLGSSIQKENAAISVDFAAADSVFTVKSFMYSIFYNLLTNGIKYKRPDTAPAILVYTRKKGDILEIGFKDNGKGIDENNFKNLFGLYKRFDTGVDGKGMGLFMTKMQVENLGGKISAESKPGFGTTFKLEFPYLNFVV